MENNIFATFGSIGLHFMHEMREKQEVMKERIKQEFIESRKYPRKKKKEIRKNLQLQWAIASWDIFDDL
jgi:hypothetical protein